MMKHKYKDIKKILKNEYFAPQAQSMTRILETLGVADSGKDSAQQAERRFATVFGGALAAAAITLCLLNIKSLKPEYLQRYTIDGILTAGESIDTSHLWQKLFPNVKE